MFNPSFEPVTPEMAFVMLSALFGAVGKVKNVETATLIAECIQMFAPGADDVGESLGLWRPISRHPLILAIAARKLTYNSVFTSAAELRAAMGEALTTIKNRAEYVERWLALLRDADRIVFEHDRAAWMEAYANLGSDVARAMQDPHESGDDDEPASAHWSALEELRLAKLIDNVGK
jgi:hypothetical protein